MQITLEALASALAPIEKIGQGETTFDVGGTVITMRMMLPEEENEVQKFASPALSGESGKEDLEAIDYLEKFKVATLSFVIMQVGDQDFRNVEYVETGEKLSNGVAVKIPRHMAIRQQVAKWSGPVRNGMFRKYGELVGRIEMVAEKSIQFEPADLDAEIERLGKRLESLKAEKARETTPPSHFSQVTKSILAVEGQEASRAQEVITQTVLTKAQAARAVSEGEAPEETPKSAPEALPAGRQPVYPQQGVPPAPTMAQKAPVQAPQAAPRPSAPVAPPPPAPAPQAAPAARHIPTAQELSESPDSLVDPSDSEGMDEAIEAENRRLAARRVAVGAGIPPAPSGSALDVIRPVRRPPHLEAAAAESQVPLAAQVDPLSDLPPGKVEFVGVVNGRETFRLPTEEVSQPTPPSKAAPLRVNSQAPDKDTRNPRFKKPGSL